MGRWTLCHVECQSLTPWRRPIWMQRLAQRAQRPKQRPHGRRSIRRNFIKLSLFPTHFRNFRANKPSRSWFFFFVGPSSFSGLRRSPWIFFPLSADICFYSALQLCLFLQFIREPAGSIFLPAETHLEHYKLFALISSPLGIKYQGQLKKWIIIIIIIASLEDGMNDIYNDNSVHVIKWCREMSEEMRSACESQPIQLWCHKWTYIGWLEY